MGAGKTTVAKALHEKIKNTAHIGMDRIKWFVSGFNRTKTQNTMTREVVLAMAKEYLLQGVNVLVEEAMKSEQINTYKKIAKASNATFLIYQLEAPKEVLFKRIADRIPLTGRTKVSKSRVLRNYRIYKQFKHTSGTVIDTSKMSANQVVNYILKDIKAL